MPLVGALAVMLVLVGFLWWALAHERGPEPADVAIAYEQAWNDLDFSLLYDLSGPELRDGMRREQFVAAKRAAYAGVDADAHGPVAVHVDIDAVTATGQTALVVTEVTTTAGGSVRNNVMLERTSNGWVVVAYTLRPSLAP